MGKSWAPGILYSETNPLKVYNPLGKGVPILPHPQRGNCVDQPYQVQDYSARCFSAGGRERNAKQGLLEDITWEQNRELSLLLRP